MRNNRKMISITRIDPDGIEELLSLYIDLFHDREPLTQCIGLSRERMLAFARSMHSGEHSNPVTQGLCWVARDQGADGRAVGFIVAEDPLAAGQQALPEDLTEHEREKASVLMALLEEVRNPVKDRIGSQAGKCLHIAALGVAPGYEGAGIASRLLKTALAEAATRGFSRAFAECTGTASRRCHEKNGFHTVASVTVNDKNLRTIPHPANGNMEIHLVWKDLS